MDSSASKPDPKTSSINSIKSLADIEFQSTSVDIWDTKYSEGYRSWIFQLTLGGKITELQLPRQNIWNKNAPKIVPFRALSIFFAEITLCTMN